MPCMRGTTWAMQEVKSAQAGGLVIAGAQVGHVAHLGGALMGGAPHTCTDPVYQN